MSSRITQYKHKALDNSELRRRREEAGVQIRKAKREEQLQKRRNVQPDLEESPGLDGVSLLNELPNILNSLMSNDPVQATFMLRKLLSQDTNPPIMEVIQAGAIPILVQLLQRTDNHILQFEAAWALTNVASGTSEQTAVIVEAGAVPIFIHLLRSPHEDVREQAVWALGNIAGDNPQCRNFCLECGIMEPLLQLLSQDIAISTLRNAVWCLSNLCRGKSPPPEFSQVSPSLPTLAKLLFHEDKFVLTDTCWAVAYLSDGPNKKIQAVIDVGVCRRLVELLEHPRSKVVSAALRAVGNIVTGDDLQTQVVLNCNVLPTLISLLNYPKEHIQKETCWALSNITAGNKQQIQAVIDANIVPSVLNTLSNADYKTRKEAAWVVANITSGGSSQHIRYVASLDALKPLSDLLSVDDPKIIIVSLTAIDNILRIGEQIVKEAQNSIVNPYALQIEECFGLDKIEYLQQHRNKEIYDKAFNIIEKYFHDSEDQLDIDNAVQPASSSAGYDFSAGAALDTQGGFEL